MEAPRSIQSPRIAVGVRLRLAALFLALVLAPALVWAQPAGSGTAAPTAPATTEVPKDPLGRDTPRGTVLGFIGAATKESDAASQYLNTRLGPDAAKQLAHQLFVVLDTRLPARLNALSDKPEGSIPNPLKPNQDVVGTIETDSGPLEIVVERVTRGTQPPVWLFSRATLDRIPEVFEEVNLVAVESYLPGFLTKTRLARVRLFEWLVFLLVIPICYRVVGLLNMLLSYGVARVRHRQRRMDVLPGPLRLLLLAIAVRWVRGGLDLPLIERQFWSAVESMLALVSVVWMLLRLNRQGAQYLERRVKATDTGELATILRLGQRAADLVVLAAGGLVGLHYFGVDPTAALAGLGIGGIAVALAAQKTLENMIGGFSIFFDKAVRVGDFLKLGETVGQVDHIGLRSTRIRTMDRTILSVPNGQIANANIETLSARDKAWFHHVVALRYETTAAQMRAVVDGITKILASHPAVEHDDIRVRFFRLGAFSLDVEVFAYIPGGDWSRFLEIQQELLLRIMEIVERSGTGIALPSQTLQLADTPARASLSRTPVAP